MDQYLKTSRIELKNLEKGSSVTFVIGNESCDLDSAVCCITYGYFLHFQQKSKDIAIPLLQVSQVKWK